MAQPLSKKGALCETAQFQLAQFCESGRSSLGFKQPLTHPLILSTHQATLMRPSDCSTLLWHLGRFDGFELEMYDDNVSRV